MKTLLKMIFTWSSILIQCRTRAFSPSAKTTISTFRSFLGPHPTSSLPSFGTYSSKPKLISSLSNENDQESSDTSSTSTIDTPTSSPPPLCLAEGLFAVEKPLEWTSQDCVAYIRGMLERDARDRGCEVDKRRRRGGNRKKRMKVGHGGTLDPLATGVLVIGVGQGTKQLQGYLDGSKQYQAVGEFGYETNTLDLEGNVTSTKASDHITITQLQTSLSQFRGLIEQTPPIFSALKKNGQALYTLARKEGKTEDDIDIPSREVMIHQLDLLENEYALPHFGLLVECGGGTYIRSLVRDIGRAMDSAATMTGLVRTKQGPFQLQHCLKKEDWSPENIYRAIEVASEEILIPLTEDEKEESH